MTSETHVAVCDKVKGGRAAKNRRSLNIDSDMGDS